MILTPSGSYLGQLAAGFVTYSCKLRFLHDTDNLGFLGAPVVKNPPAMQEMPVRSLGWEDPLEKEMTTHSSVLAWKIPRRRSLVGYSL